MAEPAPITPGSASPPSRAATSRRRVPSIKVTLLAAAAGFLIVFELLAYQLRSGHDPALGGGQTMAQVRTASGRPAVGAAAPGSSAATRTSGAVATPSASASPQSVGAVAGSGSQTNGAPHRITTRTSGGGAHGARQESPEREGRADA